MIHSRRMDCEFIVDDETESEPCAGVRTGWELVIFEIGDEPEESRNLKAESRNVRGSPW